MVIKPYPSHVSYAWLRSRMGNTRGAKESQSSRLPEQPIALGQNQEDEALS